MAEQDTLIEFPCVFPIKVMGARRDDFSATIVALIQPLAPRFDPATLEMRASSGGNYLSLTCHVPVTSKPQLDDIYRALTAHPYVQVVL